jgi:hypothetical protein
MKKTKNKPIKKITYTIDYDVNIIEIIDSLNSKKKGEIIYWKEVRDYFRAHLIWKYTILKDGEIIKEQTADCSKLQLKFKGNKVYLGSKGARKIKYFYLARTD